MTLELSAVIPASPDRVFSVLADLDQARQWMPAIQKVEPLGSGPFGLGTSWRETRKAGKRTMESTIKVVGYEPNAKLALRVEAKPMEGGMQFTLSPEASGTRVSYRAEMKGRGFMRLMSGTINRMMEEEDADLLDRLRTQVLKGK